MNWYLLNFQVVVLFVRISSRVKDGNPGRTHGREMRTRLRKFLALLKGE